MSIIDRTVEVHEALEHAGVSHAFGGALALAYIVDPRGTIDIDVNVFLPTNEIDCVFDALATIGYSPDVAEGEWSPVAGIRLRHAEDPTPLDVFTSIDPAIYERIEARCIDYPFGPASVLLPFLSAEDLTLFKLSFGRDKDWVDLRNIAAARPDLDVEYIEGQLVALRGPTMHPRLARLRAMLRSMT